MEIICAGYPKASFQKDADNLIGLEPEPIRDRENHFRLEANLAQQRYVCWDIMLLTI